MWFLEPVSPTTRVGRRSLLQLHCSFALQLIASRAWTNLPNTMLPPVRYAGATSGDESLRHSCLDAMRCDLEVVEWLDGVARTDLLARALRADVTFANNAAITLLLKLFQHSDWCIL